MRSKNSTAGSTLASMQMFSIPYGPLNSAEPGTSSVSMGQNKKFPKKNEIINERDERDQLF